MPAIKIDGEDWWQVLDRVTGLAGVTGTDEDYEQMLSPRYIKFHGVWTVERMTLISWLQELMENPMKIHAALKRLVADGLISEAYWTSRGGSTYRVHSLNLKRLEHALAELNANKLA